MRTTITVLVRALSRTPYMSSAATASTRKTAGALNVPPSPGRTGDRLGQADAEERVQQRLQVAAPADGHRRHRHAVLEDQVPADDPRDELAERRVAVGVGAARDRDRRGQLGVGEGREQAGDPREGEGDDDRRAGIADALADDHEDAGADDRADAQRGEVEDSDRSFETVLGVAAGLAHEDVGRLAGEGTRTRRDGHGARIPRSADGPNRRWTVAVRPRFAAAAGGCCRRLSARRAPVGDRSATPRSAHRRTRGRRPAPVRPSARPRRPRRGPRGRSRRTSAGSESPAATLCAGAHGSLTRARRRGCGAAG